MTQGCSGLYFAKLGTGSGIALPCGFRSKNGKRGKTTSGKSDPCEQHHGFTSRSSSLDQTNAFDSHFNETRLPFMSVTSNGSCYQPSPGLKCLWWSVSLRGSVGDLLILKCLFVDRNIFRLFFTLFLSWTTLTLSPLYNIICK